jgi:hypothetical protein
MMLCISVTGLAARGAAVWTALGITSNLVFKKKKLNFGLSHHLNFYFYLYYYILAIPHSEMHCYTRQGKVETSEIEYCEYARCLRKLPKLSKWGCLKSADERWKAGRVLWRQ